MERCQDTIRRVAGKLVQEKKRKIEEAASMGKTYGGKDLLSLLRESTLPPITIPSITLPQ